VLTVVTVLRSGGRYGPEWVRKLHRQCAKWGPEHEFGCFADAPVDGVPCVPLRHDWPGWWAKFEAYCVEAERVLLLDLDTLIVGPLAPLVERPEPVIWHEDGIWKGTISTACVVWSGDAVRHLYEAMVRGADVIMDPAFKGRAPNGTHNDQVAVGRLWSAHPVYDTGLLPGFSVQSRDVGHLAGPPAGASLVHFCGEAKPDECGGWMQRYWEAA